MEEYLCGALEKGYARKILTINGETVVVCESITCSKDYKRTIHIDGEPANLCITNGVLLKENFNKIKSLENKVSFQPESITINIR